MRRLVPLIVILALAGCTDESPLQPRAEFGIRSADPIVVMSRNLYLGADIDILLEPGADLPAAVATVLGQVARTDFRARAAELAREIHAAQPHAVGLQEVVTYDMFLSAGNPFPTPPLIPFVPPPGSGLPDLSVDYLPTLLAELNALGSPYDVAVYQPMLGFPLPIGEVAGLTLYVHYQDAGAIIVRQDVGFENAAGFHFADLTMLNLAGFTFPRTLGWVRADVTIGDRAIRFASAHLENQSSVAVQESQATELAGALRSSPLPVILVGDFNSAANHDAPADRKTGSYRILRQSGLADLWLREPHSNRNGNTCCHDPLLDNAVQAMDQRLDIIFARFTGGSFGGRSAMEIVGRDDGRFTHSLGYTLWPSDHAGVIARLWPAN